MFFPKTPLRFPPEHVCRQSPLTSHVAIVSLYKGRTRPSPIPGTDVQCKAFLNVKQMFQSSNYASLNQGIRSIPIHLCSRCFSTCVCVSGSVTSNSAMPWTVARQAPLSTGFSRQGYWNLLQGIFLNQGLNLGLLY